IRITNQSRWQFRMNVLRVRVRWFRPYLFPEASRCVQRKACRHLIGMTPSLRVRLTIPVKDPQRERLDTKHRKCLIGTIDRARLITRHKTIMISSPDLQPRQIHARVLITKPLPKILWSARQRHSIRITRHLETSITDILHHTRGVKPKRVYLRPDSRRAHDRVDRRLTVDHRRTERRERFIFALFSTMRVRGNKTKMIRRARRQARQFSAYFRSSGIRQWLCARHGFPIRRARAVFKLTRDHITVTRRVNVTVQHRGGLLHTGGLTRAHFRCLHKRPRLAIRTISYIHDIACFIDRDRVRCFKFRLTDDTQTKFFDLNTSSGVLDHPRTNTTKHRRKDITSTIHRNSTHTRTRDFPHEHTISFKLLNPVVASIRNPNIPRRVDSNPGRG